MKDIFVGAMVKVNLNHRVIQKDLKPIIAHVVEILPSGTCWIRPEEFSDDEASLVEYLKKELRVPEEFEGCFMVDENEIIDFA